MRPRAAFRGRSLPHRPGHLSFRLWLGVAFFQAERPLNAAQNMLLVGRADLLGIFAFELFRSVGVPHVFPVSQGGVEDPAAAEFLAPGYRIKTWCLVVWMPVERQEHVHLIAMKILLQINLIEDRSE